MIYISMAGYSHASLVTRFTLHLWLISENILFDIFFLGCQNDITERVKSAPNVPISK
jgi:hypothetical protein